MPPTFPYTVERPGEVRIDCDTEIHHRDVEPGDVFTLQFGVLFHNDIMVGEFDPNVDTFDFVERQ